MLHQFKTLPDVISLLQACEQKWPTAKYPTLFILSSFTVPRLIGMLHLLKTFIFSYYCFHHLMPVSRKDNIPLKLFSVGIFY